MARSKVCTGYDNNNQPIWVYEDEVLNPTAIDFIQVNGVTQPIANKTVNLSVPDEAEDISYDNTDSGLESDNVQDALDELNSSKYAKPSTGIPSSDMTSEVQASLDKAETALQNVPNTYRTASAQDIIDGTKQAQNIQRNITIAVADWNSGTTCTKTVTGVTASNTVIVDPSDATVTATAQGADELTFTATATPSADVTVKVVILP